MLLSSVFHRQRGKKGRKGALPGRKKRRVKHRMEEKDGMLDRCGSRKKLCVCEGEREE